MCGCAHVFMNIYIGLVSALAELGFVWVRQATANTAAYGHGHMRLAYRGPCASTQERDGTTSSRTC